MEIEGLDHLVLTVADLRRTIDFYVRGLGFREVTFGGGRKALAFGRSKINLHEAGHEIEPKAVRPTPGSADLCFAVRGPLGPVVERLTAAGIAIELGPVARTGALGPMTSVYVHDPDGNLVELASYEPYEPPR